MDVAPFCVLQLALRRIGCYDNSIIFPRKVWLSHLKKSARDVFWRKPSITLLLYVLLVLHVNRLDPHRPNTQIRRVGWRD